MLFVLFAMLSGILGFTILGEMILWVSLPAIPITLILFFITKNRANLALEYVFVITTFLALSAIGGLLSQINQTIPSHSIQHLQCKPAKISGTVLKNAKATRKAATTWIQAEYLLVEPPVKITGNFLVYFPDDQPCLQKNDQIECLITLDTLQKMNPGYLQYLRSKGVSMSGYSKNIVKTGSKSSFTASIEAFRNHLSQRLRKNADGNSNIEIAIAMLLGDRSGLSSDDKENFKKAGLSHILAISGLHVGLIYLMLEFVLSFFAYSPLANQCKRGVIIVILIGYAILTGASPAVCRAVFMFSCFLLAQILHRKTKSLNILAFSAFCMLCFQPNLIFDLGFQLSYAAVTGILLVSPILSRWLVEKAPWIPRNIRGMLIVTLSAQVFTSPLIWVHFGEFPTYFLLSNMLILPLVMFTVGLGLVSIVTSFVPFLGEFICWILTQLLAIICMGTEMIADLPGAVISQLSWSEPGVPILASILVSCLLVILGIHYSKVLLNLLQERRIQRLNAC